MAWQVIRVTRFEVRDCNDGVVVDARTGDPEQWTSYLEALKAADDLNNGEDAD